MSGAKKTTLLGARGWALEWRPPGPVAAAFFASDARVGVMVGPLGSAKTTTALAKLIARAMRQQPDPRDGVRRTKWRILRNTLGNLKETTIPSWWKLVPKNTPGCRWTDDPHPAHEVRLQIAGIGVVEAVFEFVPVGEHRIEDIMRGWEGTGGLAEELDTLPPDTITQFNSRLGRYPGMDAGGPSWTGILATLNAPDEDSWTHDPIYLAPPESWEIFQQPGGRDAGAENLDNLPPGYYDNLVRGAPAWWVRRFVDNKPGLSRAGKPVYPAYDELVHVQASSLPLDPSLPLHVGGDAGRHPAAVIGQVTAEGQLRVLGELYRDNVAAKSFGEQLNLYLARRFPELAAHRLRGFPIYGWGDPAAGYATQTDESTWLEIMAAITKFAWSPAPVPDNSITLRLEAVNHRLLLTVGGRRGLLLSGPDCAMLRRGFMSGYHYRRVAGQTGRFHDTPDKNDYSNPHDALQYLALGACGIASILGRASASLGGRQQLRAIDESHGLGDPSVWGAPVDAGGYLQVPGRWLQGEALE